MSDVLFLRHGETNLAGTFCGHSDPPLNDRGLLQVASLLEQLSDETIDVIYSSDLRRAKQTATAIATAKRVPLHILPALREINFGDWEALRWHEIEARDKSYAERWLAAYPTLAAPGGESVDEFETRILAVVESLLRNDSRRFAVVSHAGVMRVILHRLCGVAEEECLVRTKEYCSMFRYFRPVMMPVPTTPGAQFAIEGWR